VAKRRKVVEYILDIMKMIQNKQNVTPKSLKCARVENLRVRKLRFFTKLLREGVHGFGTKLK
jgi:hypothetical protein